MKGREEETANTTTKISSYSPASSSKKRFVLLIQVTLKYLTALHVGLIPLKFHCCKFAQGIAIVIILSCELDIKELQSALRSYCTGGAHTPACIAQQTCPKEGKKTSPPPPNSVTQARASQTLNQLHPSNRTT